MPSRRDENLARVSAESREHVAKADKSNVDSTAHVRSSRAAVERSLRLLAQTARQVPEQRE